MRAGYIMLAEVLVVYGVGVGAGEIDENVMSPSCFSGVSGREVDCVNHSDEEGGNGETDVNGISLVSSRVRGS